MDLQRKVILLNYTSFLVLVCALYNNMSYLTGFDYISYLLAITSTFMVLFVKIDGLFRSVKDDDDADYTDSDGNDNNKE